MLGTNESHNRDSYNASINKCIFEELAHKRILKRILNTYFDSLYQIYALNVFQICFKHISFIAFNDK